MIRHNTTRSTRLRAAVIGAGLAAAVATGVGVGVGTANAAPDLNAWQPPTSHSTHHYGDSTYGYPSNGDRSQITGLSGPAQFDHAQYYQRGHHDRYSSEYRARTETDHHHDRCRQHRERANDHDVPGHPDRFEPGEMYDAG